jgi:hypothetical protein
LIITRTRSKFRQNIDTARKIIDYFDIEPLVPSGSRHLYGKDA